LIHAVAPGSTSGKSIVLVTKRKPRRINFTKAALESIRPPSEGRLYVYDERMPGLALCITAADSRTFYVYRKINGKPERILLGP
jgi:hypothetical protein